MSLPVAHVSDRLRPLHGASPRERTTDVDQSGSVDDSEKDARIARRRSRSAVSLTTAHLKELTTGNATVLSTLHAAGSRLAVLYADQSRMEEDIVTCMEIAEKRRSQVQDLEREKREVLRRYTEQTATFEAERQALYDDEQHLKSRIQSMTAARKFYRKLLKGQFLPHPPLPIPLRRARLSRHLQQHQSLILQREMMMLKCQMDQKLLL
ncbi:hypothetical protein JB92DRAFT_3130814 [Gautieria morchelliformis]|nr:hypothetical protein JB92DRAFT_3130814 [Gautieria morchelliformis]